MRTKCLLWMIALIVTTVAAITGCKSNKIPNVSGIVTSCPPSHSKQPGLAPSYLDIEEPAACDGDYFLDSLSPDSVLDYHNINYQPISLQQCIIQGLQKSEVFRDLGGAIISSPATLETAVDPALTYIDPQFGEEAALSAFDANFITSAFFENNDRPFNNLFSGDSNGLFQQDLIDFRTEINKLSANGTLFNARSNIIYDANNQAGNRFPHSYEAALDFGFRHPLLQGSGSLFNRIAGPSQTPGVYNGVLIARTNTEISLADFEAGVRDLVSDIENAYWDLYYAYRELEAQVNSRDVAKEVYDQVKEREEAGLEIDSAYEQLLRFETAIVDSLEGRIVEGTVSSSGATGGSFRRAVGVRTSERRLRYLMGMPITDGNLLQPSDVPVAAPIRFDWEESVHQAVAQRPETRRQRWTIKQKELELTAARNFLLPRLDVVGNYRFRGLGRSLTGGDTTLAGDILNGTALSSAVTDLGSGDFQEVQLGLEYRTPVGFRRGHAAVRFAELSVQREKALLNEQIHRIVLDLSNAISEVRRAYSAKQVSQQRFNAANKYFVRAKDALERDRVQIDVKLEAQRRILESHLQFLNAEAEYAIAVKNVHVERGSYLRFHGIDLAESVSSPQAYQANDIRIQGADRPLNYVMRDSIVSRGPSSDLSFTTIDPGSGAEFGPILDQGTYVDQGPVVQTLDDIAPVDTNISDNVPVDATLSNPGTEQLNYWNKAVDTNISDSGAGQ